MLHISISVFKINPWNVELGRLIAKAGSILDNPGGINFSQHNYVEFILEEKYMSLKCCWDPQAENDCVL